MSGAAYESYKNTYRDRRDLDRLRLLRLRDLERLDRLRSRERDDRDLERVLR